MHILISNDDGIMAPGLRALETVVHELGTTTTVAPHRERSTMSHSLTLHKPLRVHECGEKRYSVSGSPADCIYLGTRKLCPQKPDLVLSGINHGANLGTDIHYSGTVAAAREATLMGIPSFAFSLVDKAYQDVSLQTDHLHFETAAKFCLEVVRKILPVGDFNRTFFNVNVPNVEESSVRGIKLTRQGIRYYQSQVDERVDLRGKTYFWIGGAYEGFIDDVESDCEALENNYVAVTPISIDCTHCSNYDTLSSVF